MRLRGLRTFTGLAAAAVVFAFCGATAAHADTGPQPTVQAIPDADLPTTPLADGPVDERAAPAATPDDNLPPAEPAMTPDNRDEPAMTADDGASVTPLTTAVTARRCPHNSEVELPLGPLGDRVFTDSQIETYCRLSPDERAVCDLDLLRCAGVAQPAHDFAYQYDTSIGGPRTQPDNRADAARHCLWQLNLSVFAGEDYAARWGDAHEHSPDPAQSHAMDLHNNMVARAAYQRAFDMAHETMSTRPQVGPEKMRKDAVLGICGELVQQAVHVKAVDNPHDNPQGIRVTGLESTDNCSPDNTLDNLVPCDISKRLVYIND